MRKIIGDAINTLGMMLGAAMLALAIFWVFQHYLWSSPTACVPQHRPWSISL